jgi:head-tail adaptor
MRAGRWRLTHQGIAFSSNRVLLDGQHRLWAVLISGVTVPMRIFFNESPESLGVIDAVRPRSNDEIISLSGGMGTVTRRELATLRAMIAGLNSYERMTAGQEAEVLARHRAAVAFAHEILPQSRFRGVATGVTRGVLARAFYSADHGKLRRFADVLQSGIGSEEADQPIMLLFRYLVETAGRAHGEARRRDTYAKTERALSAYLRGERLTRLCATTSEWFPIPHAKLGEAAA